MSPLINFTYEEWNPGSSWHETNNTADGSTLVPSQPTLGSWPQSCLDPAVAHLRAARGRGRVGKWGEFLSASSLDRSPTFWTSSSLHLPSKHAFVLVFRSIRNSSCLRPSSESEISSSDWWYSVLTQSPRHRHGYRSVPPPHSLCPVPYWNGPTCDTP